LINESITINILRKQMTDTYLTLRSFNSNHDACNNDKMVLLLGIWLRLRMLGPNL